MRSGVLSSVITRRGIVSLAAVAAFLVASVSLADIISGVATTNSSTNVTITNLTLTNPSVSEGDLMLASIALHDGSATSITPPSGWTFIQRTDYETNVGLVSYYKVASASEPLDYTWTLSPQTRAEGGITPYSGVDTANSIDAVASNFGRGHVATTTSITTVTDNAEVVAVYTLHVGPGTHAGDFFSLPVGMTEKYDISYTTAGPTIAAFDKIQATAGVVDSISSDIAGNRQRDWASQVIALRRGPIDCTGGTIAHVGSNTIHTFTTVGASTLDCSAAGAKPAKILVVGGGGGGGAYGGGGGGAGGYIASSTYSLSATSHTIVVGIAGTGCVDDETPGGCDTQNPTNGGDSKLDSLLAYGGGFGSSGTYPWQIANSGGSGGGFDANAGSGGAGITGQGNNGGDGSGSSGGQPGGGGGAGAAGGNGGGGYAGNGGAGIANSISGTTVTYAGGGGGGGSSLVTAGRGGAGGGGNGGASGVNGTDAAGYGGGGGGAGTGAFGGDGGSGIVIVSYPTL